MDREQHSQKSTVKISLVHSVSLAPVTFLLKLDENKKLNQTVHSLTHSLPPQLPCDYCSVKLCCVFGLTKHMIKHFPLCKFDNYDNRRVLVNKSNRWGEELNGEHTIVDTVSCEKVGTVSSSVLC